MGLVYTDNFETESYRPKTSYPYPSSSSSSSSTVSNASSYLAPLSLVSPSKKQSRSKSSSSSYSTTSNASGNSSSIVSLLFSPRSSFSSSNSAGGILSSSSSAKVTTHASSNYVPFRSHSNGYYNYNTLYEEEEEANECTVQILRCQKCHNHISLSPLVLSDNFYGNKGPALFVSKILNCEISPIKSQKHFKTGNYEIRNLFCLQCDINLGWKYISAEDDREKYKEGNYVIERKLLEVVDAY